MIPDLITAKITAIACAACLAIGAAGGGYAAHVFYAPRLELAEYQAEVMGESIRRQNQAVDELEKAGDARAKKAAAAIAAASAAAQQAEQDAIDILAAQPPPGENRCTAASALIRKELAR